ncbi:MAG: hypothetical protein U0930_04305 [Pirellulales bacterium]
MNSDSETLIRAMERIRRAKAAKLAQLGEESQRLTDWREYVRSAPVASLVGAVVVGAMVGSKLYPKPLQTMTVSAELPTSQSQFQSSLTNRLVGSSLSLVLPMFHAVVKQHLTAAVSNAIQSLSEPRRSKDDSPA